LTYGDFIRFKNKNTLEIGVGLGSDHMKLAEAGAILTGVDITTRSINHTRRRFELLNYESKLFVADVEALPFTDNEFDAIYSWGVLHHTPNTQKAVEEVYRVLKPGGFAKIMIYNKYSLVGFMLWMRYGLLKFKPFISLESIYFNYLESAGTKAYSYVMARELFYQFKIISINSPLGQGDLLTSKAGQRHEGILLSLARKIWPRWFFKMIFPNYGLYLIIEVEKP
jgi:ubiquinone/menaquinone biosynthesis C-methylase UbiE